MQPVPRAELCTAGDAVASRAQRYAGADGLQGGGCKEAAARRPSNQGAAVPQWSTAAALRQTRIGWECLVV